jgi:hypothetical protein
MRYYQRDKSVIDSESIPAALVVDTVKTLNSMLGVKV